MMVADRGGSIPNDAYEYSLDEMFGLHRKIIDPEMQEVAKVFRGRAIIP